MVDIPTVVKPAKITINISGARQTGKTTLMEIIFRSIIEKYPNTLLKHENCFEEAAHDIAKQNIGNVNFASTNSPIIEIVESYDKNELMRIIKLNDDLIVGRKYWAREKTDNSKLCIVTCYEHDHWKYLQASLYSDKFWAMDRNNQALDRWDILGPIAEQPTPNFDDYLK